MEASCPKVSCDSPVTHGVVSVGGQTNFDDVVAFQTHHLSHGGSRLEPIVQNHDAVVARAQRQLVFRTNHAHGNLTADFPFLDFEGLSFEG